MSKIVDNRVMSSNLHVLFGVNFTCGINLVQDAIFQVFYEQLKHCNNDRRAMLVELMSILSKDPDPRNRKRHNFLTFAIQKFKNISATFRHYAPIDKPGECNLHVDTHAPISFKNLRINLEHMIKYEKLKLNKALFWLWVMESQYHQLMALRDLENRGMKEESAWALDRMNRNPRIDLWSFQWKIHEIPLIVKTTILLNELS